MARKTTAKAADKASAAASTAAGPLVAEAENYDKVRAALETDSASVSPLWLSFLTFGTYLAIAIGAVTHRQLFLEDPVKLPVLNVDLPLVGFFTLAPILYLIFHAYLLLNLALMAEDARRYDEFLKARQLDPVTELHLRQQLPNSLFLRLLAGPRRPRASMIDWLLIMIAWLTVVIGPVLLLVIAQLQFLPFHSGFATWMQRGVTVVDLGLLWWFWPLVLRGVSVRGRLRATAQAVACALSLCIVIFTVFVATYPGGDLYRLWITGAATEHLFEGPPNEVSGKQTSWFSNRLILPDQDFVDDDVLQKMIARQPPSVDPWTGERMLSLRGRDLRGAVLIRVDLRRADLIGVKLEGANLHDANLAGASFGCAHTGQSAGPIDPNGDALDCAQLQGTVLDRAQLQGALLSGAQLQGARLLDSGLQGAMLNGAQLQGAVLDGADLEGASAATADLQGASLGTAKLLGAALLGAGLQGAVLDSAQLTGAALDGAELQGASFRGAELQDASLDSVDLWRADATDASGPLFNLPVIDLPIVWHPVNGEEASSRDRQIEKWLAGIPEGQMKDDARARLNVLVEPSSPDAEQRWAEAWKALPGPGDDVPKTFREGINIYACNGGPNEAAAIRGMASNLFYLFGFDRRSSLPDVARDLLACPIAKFLDQNTLDRLAVLATKARYRTNRGGAPTASTPAVASDQ